MGSIGLLVGRAHTHDSFPSSGYAAEQEEHGQVSTETKGGSSSGVNEGKGNAGACGE